MTPSQTLQDIRNVMSQIIRAGLTNQQKFPGMRRVGHNETEIYIEGAPDLSASLKIRPYSEIYTELDAGGAFNLKMIDGSLIQMMYTFKRSVIRTHRLSLFPPSGLDPYEVAQLSYDADEMFAEFTGAHIVRFPIRFDYSEADHIDVDHPKSHLTLGQYKNCRLPVTAPLSPTRFMRFVIRNFYWPALSRVPFAAPQSDPRFLETITVAERCIPFLSA